MKTLISTLIAIATLAFTINLTAQTYDNAVGLRVGWGIAGTYKHFFSEKIAGEGILNYWGRGSLGFKYSQTKVSALVEVHNNLDNVYEGLQWYYGGGAFVQFWGGSYSSFFEDYNTTQIGISGVIGADYKFANIPLSISLDWMPGLSFVGGGGFIRGSGGAAIRYTF